MRAPKAPSPMAVVVLIALLGIVGAGVVLRLEDPLATEAIGAEDPYTHVVFVKEWLGTGRFGDSVHLGTGMYPPGMHAFVGIVAPLSGVPLYDFARFVPVVFGALGIVGVYVLAARLLNPAAGLAAALLMAIMPEVVFRTNLLFPTALDLALLPAFLLAFYHAWRPQLGSWSAGPEREAAPGILLFLLMVPVMALTHPWVVPLFLAPALAHVALRALREAPRPGAAMAALLVPVALAVVAVAFAMASRWEESDTGFADFISLLPLVGTLAGIGTAPPLLFLRLLVILAVVAAPAVLLVGGLVALRRRVPRVLRVALAAAAAVALVASLPFLTRDLPPDVSYLHMLGKLAIGLGLAGLLLAWLRPSSLGDLAIAIVLPIFPLTAINIFDSPFWPQRTVAYLALGVALLAGHAVGVLHAAAVSVLEDARPRRWAAPTMAALAILALTGAATAAPPSNYSWYRLYSDDEMEGFHHTADILAGEPDARVVVGNWQSGLMIKTFADLGQVWYSPRFFQEEAKRGDILGKIPGEAYVIVEKNLLEAEEDGEADLGFLEHGARLVHESGDGRYRLYVMEDSS